MVLSQGVGSLFQAAGREHVHATNKLSGLKKPPDPVTLVGETGLR